MADKKGLAILIGGVGKPPMDEGEGDEDSGELAAKALIKAVGSKDSAGVLEAFRALQSACEEDDEDKESVDEKESEK